MSQLYPLKFKPILKEKIWGGKRLAELFGKPVIKSGKMGESWEISSVKGAVSQVRDGFLKGNDLNEIIEIYMGDLVGDSVYEKFGNELPLLVKLIDSEELLSLQVHPDDQLAFMRHGSYGKSEFWHVLEADEGSAIINGFREDLEKQEFLDLLVQKRITEKLNVIHAESGDSFFIPAGRVHCLSGGLLLAEIQQNSDFTYRIYDWDRKDEQGKSRDLHLELALDAIDYNKTVDPLIKAESNKTGRKELIHSPYFTCNLLQFEEKLPLDYFFIDSFVVYICTEGEFRISGYGSDCGVKRGESILIPAIMKNFELTPLGKTSVLEVYLQLNEQGN